MGPAERIRIESGRLTYALRHPRGGPWTYAIAAAASLAFVLVWWMLRDPDLAPTTRTLTGYRADDTDWLTVVRLPLSVFAPTRQLPAWADGLQLFVALALGSAVLGARLTVLVGMAAHVLASIAGRVLLGLPAWAPGHLAAAERSALDTGPSVAFVSIVVCSLLVLGAYVYASVFVLVTAAIGALSSDLAGTEHGIGLLFAVAAAVAIRRHATVRSP